MQSLLTLILILGIVILFLLASKYFKFTQQDQDEEETISYHKNKYFLTDAEKNFFFILKPIADRHNLLIFSKVRLLDLFYVPKYDRASRARIIQKHVDFVLCKSNDINPICAIELDDSSHNQESRIERDDFVNEVFSSANLPLIRIKNASSYNQQELETKITSLLAQK